MTRFFETSYLAFELTRKENLAFVQEVISHLKYLEENENNTWKYRDTADHYFNIRPVGGERPFQISDLEIHEADLIACATRAGLQHTSDKEFVEDSSMDEYRVTIQHAACFSNGSYALFYTTNNAVVITCWIDIDDHLAADRDRIAFSSFLFTLAKTYGLILVDWYRHAIIDAGDEGSIENYLSALSGS